MRKLAVAGASLVLLLAATAAVAATTWPTVKLIPTVSSTKAGTKKHPKGETLTTVIKWQKLGAAKQPIVTKFLVWFPRGSKYNGKKYASCSRTKVAGGPSKCPKHSIMGSGRGTAYASTTKTHPKITVINGGAKTIYFWTVLNNPARVREPVVGHLKKLSSGKYAYKLKVKVPKNLQIVAGTPIELTYLQVTAGGKSYAPKWLATTGCFGGQWPFKIKTAYLNPNNGKTGSAKFASSVHCKK
jgi:hypothetical protein